MSLRGDLLKIGVDSNQMAKVGKAFISSAELKALKATPQVIVPSFGSQTLTMLIGGAIKYLPGGTGYTVSTNSLIIQYDTGVSLNTTIDCAGFIDDNTARVAGIFPATVLTPMDVEDSIGRALRIAIGGAAEVTLGNGSLIVMVMYRTFKF